MNIIVIGLSHKTASVEVREKLSIPEAQVEEAIAHLRGYPHIEEVAIISTCNRLEIYSRTNRNGSSTNAGFATNSFSCRNCLFK